MNDRYNRTRLRLGRKPRAPGPRPDDAASGNGLVSLSEQGFLLDGNPDITVRDDAPEPEENVSPSRTP